MMQTVLSVEYIPSSNVVLQAPLKLEDGHFRPSQEPGLGIDWDLDKLESFRVKL
jgi:L-alanine-DL-glutamate epimerase-like enolase superfamily enzyme